MIQTLRAILSMLLFALLAVSVKAATILAPGDFIIGVDTDAPTSNSSSPSANEASTKVIDGLANTKYLNFGQAGSGFIVTPGGSTTVRSFQLSTGGDAVERDPSSFELWGTNSAIASGNNSIGLAEPWTFIDGFTFSGGTALPAGRNTLGPIVPITNSTAYSSYKMIYPTVKNAPSGANSMQVGEAMFWESNNGSGTDLLDSSDPIVAMHIRYDSRSPDTEGPVNLLDADANTKYLNFGKVNSGFIITPAVGASIVRTFQLTTANDAESRDPTSWILYGTNDTIGSRANSQGGGESWTLIESGTVDLPIDRLAAGPFVPLGNGTSYKSYRMVFPTMRNAGAGDADSLQIGGLQFFDVVIPEPSSAILFAIACAFGSAVTRQRRK